MIDDLKTLFVCATKRSGSTFICRWITQQPDMPNVREWFESFHFHGFRRQFGMPEDIPLETLLKRIRAHEAQGDWFGFKIMIGNLRILLDGRSDPAYENASMGALVAQYFPKAKFVWLTREDKVAQAISFTKALQTGVWEVRPAGPKPEPRKHPLRYSFLDIEKQREEVADEEIAWANFFQAIGVEPLIISYEAFRADPEMHIRQVRALMGLDTEAEIMAPQAETKVAQTFDATNRTWLDLYAKDRARLGPVATKLERPEILSLQSADTSSAGPQPELNWEVLITLKNPNAVPFPRLFGATAKECPRLTAIWIASDTGKSIHKDAQELPMDIEAGGPHAVPVLLTTPMRPGRYRLEMALTTDGQLDCSKKCFVTEVVCQFAEPLQTLHSLLGSFVNYHGQWICSPWFGFIYVIEFPWLYHDEHGWLECGPKSETGELAFTDAGLGAWTTTRARYPEITQLSSGKTLRYDRNEGDQRIFLDENGLVVKAVKTTGSS